MLVISIITPFYNGKIYLKQSFAKIANGCKRKIVHIIIDDGSTDGETLKSFMKNTPTVKLLYQEHQGQYAAMNTGLCAAATDIVCFVNQDDIIPSGAIEAVLSYLQSHPKDDAVVGAISYIDKRGNPLHKLHPLWNFPLWTYPYTSNIYHGALYVRREFLVKNKLFFDPALHYAGDYDWIMRLLKAGIKLGRIKTVLLNFRVHTDQISEKNFQASRREIFEVAKRHHLNMFLLSMTRKLFFLFGLWDNMRTLRLIPVLEYLNTRLNRK